LKRIDNTMILNLENNYSKLYDSGVH